ncbi:MAG: signal peptide peptidase SppA [Bacteroidota bacterium]
MQYIKQILRQVLIVVISIFISLFISILLIIGVGASLAQLSKPKITDKTVLHIVLRGKVVEHSPITLRQLMQRERDEEVDLIALKCAIKNAQKDKNIRGIYLEAHDLSAGWATLEEIRSLLLSFKEAGKFVVAYSEQYTQKAYYLASLADEIVLHPAGLFNLKGLSQTFFFYKGLFDKLQVTPQVFRVGQYKSAVEPFTRQDMSQASKHQSNALLKVIHNHFLDKIAAARGLQQASIQAMMDNLSAVLPQDACSAKLVSRLGHFDDVEALIRGQLSLSKEAHINYVAFGKYASIQKHPQSDKNQIAVLIAEGTIVEGTGTPGTIGAKGLAASLRAIREDASIKAVVLRINSPGGSALAADVLWKELVLTKDRKPVVASMSDIAASGGYYLAVACNRIFAQPTTITGSIGIFGLFFDVHALLNNALGITTDVVKTGKSADLFENVGRPFHNHESVTIQRIVDQGYNIFLDRVAAGRSMERKLVENVASGRVWAGQLAKERGLVDELGGLEAAIQTAARLSGIDKEYTVSYWPKPKSWYNEILSDIRSHIASNIRVNTLKETFPVLQHIQELIDMRGIHARLPYTIEIE